MNSAIDKLNTAHNLPKDFYQACAPDGVVSWGWRKVRKNGTVKFDNAFWQHESLIPYIGQYVIVSNDSGYWCTRVRVMIEYSAELKYLICVINAE